MNELTALTAAQAPGIAAARSALATVNTWGGGLPLQLRLAAAAAAAELEVRADLPYPPAEATADDPRLTPAAATMLLTAVRDRLAAEIGDADPIVAVSVAFAVRELAAALDDPPDMR